MASMALAEQGLITRPAWPMIANRNGPGELDPYNLADALLFDTSSGAARIDALAVFFADELPSLDWLADYVMDETVKTYARDAEPSFEIEEEEEIHFEKKALTTTDTDSSWDV